MAGVIPFKIAQQMAKSATSVLWRTYREVPINIQAVQVCTIKSAENKYASIYLIFFVYRSPKMLWLEMALE